MKTNWKRRALEAEARLTIANAKLRVARRFCPPLLGCSACGAFLPDGYVCQECGEDAGTISSSSTEAAMYRDLMEQAGETP